MYVYQFYEHELNLCQLCRIFLPLELAILFPWVQGPLLTELSFLLDFIFLLYILLQWLVLTLFKLMFFKGARASQTVK